MTPKLKIKLDDLTGEPVKKILTAHLSNAAKLSPKEAIFALDIDGLRVPEVSFWTVWQGDSILACGALKLLGEQQAEIKSMHTLEKSRGQGVASQLLIHILEQAKLKKVTRVSLETGTAEAFFPAHQLYRKHGFVECEPFADYEQSIHSLYMARSV